MKVAWRDVFKFLAGAFFAASGVSGYLFWMHVALPVPFAGIGPVSPDLIGVRGVVQLALFVACFYFGFLRKSPTRV